ncbi:hypothetical protein Naga_101660g1 [Nannochloropsis gaditana]|uniref:DUF4110 domain-containing protein n=1 Tax=Nannochloropsis gaditana TaxID=72520 RepID=W7UCD9_9STRA|nr:hypothetical protein Naga_101660g1 [Nannochloropsis gaditana]
MREKEYKTMAFELAVRRFEELRPVLERLNELEVRQVSFPRPCLPPSLPPFSFLRVTKKGGRAALSGSECVTIRAWRWRQGPQEKRTGRGTKQHRLGGRVSCSWDFCHACLYTCMHTNAFIPFLSFSLPSLLSSILSPSPPPLPALHLQRAMEEKLAERAAGKSAKGGKAAKMSQKEREKKRR